MHVGVVCHRNKEGDEKIAKESDTEIDILGTKFLASSFTFVQPDKGVNTENLPYSRCTRQNLYLII